MNRQESSSLENLQNHAEDIIRQPRKQSKPDTSLRVARDRSEPMETTVPPDNRPETIKPPPDPKKSHKIENHLLNTIRKTNKEKDKITHVDRTKKRTESK